MAGTVGSDAHAAFELGRSVMLLDLFEDADGLRRVLALAGSERCWSPLWFHLASRYATLRKKIPLGLDTIY